MLISPDSEGHEQFDPGTGMRLCGPDIADLYGKIGFVQFINNVDPLGCIL